MKEKIITGVSLPGIPVVRLEDDLKLVVQEQYQPFIQERFLERDFFSLPEALTKGVLHGPRKTSVILLVHESYLQEQFDSILSWNRGGDEGTDFKLLVVTTQARTKFSFDSHYWEIIYFAIPESVLEGVLLGTIANTVHAIQEQRKCRRYRFELSEAYQDVKSLNKVGSALLNERDFDRLIELILTQTREVLGADGGSIYVVEPPESPGEKPRKLRFKKSALNLDADEFLLNIDKNSIAGYVALTGEALLIDDVYELNGDEEYHFNSDFDKLHGYHTKSMMLVPMKNHRNEVIGVIQLINKKADPQAALTLKDMEGDGVIPFTQRCFDIAASLAGQAAVAIENNLLIEEIQHLFEGFVKASVKAIEQRDPTTSGHSARVAEYTESIALAVDGMRSGPFADVRFQKEQIRELRYASLLHDFGKVGVREKVLIKPKKLYPEQLELIRWRFQYIQKALENDYLLRKIELLEKGGSDVKAQIEQLEADMEFDKKKVTSMFEAITQANEPTVVEEGDFKFLETLTTKNFLLDDGTRVPFLYQNELLNLSVKKGTLDATERAEIESHVSHTFQFLSQIPWTGSLKNVAQIAHGHHEKLDGSGYPIGLNESSISLQTRMMTISDIFDALTAWDRPYKKALSTEAALDILHLEVKDKHIDGDLLKVFIESETYKKVQRKVNL